jgi:hypothetical protein
MVTALTPGVLPSRRRAILRFCGMFWIRAAAPLGSI